MNLRFVILLIAMIAMLHLHGQGSLRPRGDVNCDWEINLADVNTLVDSILNGAKYNSFYSFATDVNGDMEINIADLNAVLDAIMGKQLAPMPTYSGTLPVLYINTEGHRNIDSKENYLQAEWWLDNMGIEGYESIGSATAPLGMQIKGRGNATWKRNGKKPFRLKLNEKHEILGMPSNRHWVLLANAAYWQGMINDMLPFEIGRRMGMAWNPRQEPVEVVLNGQYIGLYFLTEKIRVDKSRVNIIEQDDGETNLEKVTGGWLLEIDNYKEPNRITIVDGNGHDIWFTYHSPEVLSNVQKNYITNFLNKAKAAIFTRNKNDSTWEEYIDVDSLAIFYMVQEIADNIESFAGSCFIHKQRGENTKLIFGPLWDCGCTYYRWTSTYEFNEFIYENVPSFSSVKWMNEIVKFPHFQERMRHHWQHFYQDIYPTMDEYLDAFAARIDQAGMCDFDRWHNWGFDNIVLRLNKYGKPSFHKKVAWLQSQWGDGQ